MKNLLIILFFICYSSFAQNMNVKKLGEIIIKKADSIKEVGNTWEFFYKDRLLVCIADSNANRMRIISPIAKQNLLDKTLILNSLTANFHTALDVKYALSNDVLWSVFTHPLKELSSHQIEDAINQVYNANITFGTIYSSTPLTFPATAKKEAPKQKKDYLQSKI